MLAILAFLQICYVLVPPNANCLILVCKVVRPVIVVGLDDVAVGSVVVLGAAVRGEVLVVAGILSHLAIEKQYLSLE